MVAIWIIDLVSAGLIMGQFDGANDDGSVADWEKTSKRDEDGTKVIGSLVLERGGKYESLEIKLK